MTRRPLVPAALAVVAVIALVGAVLLWHAGVHTSPFESPTDTGETHHLSWYSAPEIIGSAVLMLVAGVSVTSAVRRLRT